MKKLKILVLTFLVVLIACNQNGQSSQKAENTEETQQTIAEIQTIIKNVLIWSDTKESISLIPAISDSMNSFYIGLDIEKHKQNIEKLKKTDFFAAEFIDNYNQIILTIDKNLRNGTYEKWLVGDLPTFIFANDYNPWWNGQESFSLDCGKVELINLTKNTGEFYFVCGASGESCEGMENYKMKFRVSKDAGKWRISYLEGFNYKESTRKDGVL